MTMVSTGGIIYWPKKILRPAGGFTGQSWSSLSGSAFTLDSTSDAVAWVGKSPVSDTLTTIYFRTATIGAGGGDTVDVRIETVADGRPTGTLFAANTNITVAIADGDDNVWKTATLTAGAALTVGDEFAIVIASSAGTPAITLYLASPNFLVDLYPIMLQNSAGSYAVPATNGGALAMIAAFTTAGVVPLPNILPIDGDPTLTAFNSGTSPDERAVKFVLPFKARVTGAGVALGNFAAASGFTCSIWPETSDDDTDAIVQSTLDGDFAYSTSDDGFVEFEFAGQTLDKDTTYYLGVRADAANSGTMYQVTSPAAITGSMRGFNLPATYHLATRVWDAGAAGAWTDAENTLPISYLIIDQVDDGEGAGGAGGGNANVLGGSVVR